jgi:hypothetical protein
MDSKIEPKEEPQLPLIDLVSRLVRLETIVELKTNEMDKDLCFARDHNQQQADAIRASMERRDDEIKNYFVVEIKAVYAQLDGIKKMVYIGLGIVTALSALLKFVGK